MKQLLLLVAIACAGCATQPGDVVERDYVIVVYKHEHGKVPEVDTVLPYDFKVKIDDPLQGSSQRTYYVRWERDF